MNEPREEPSTPPRAPWWIDLGRRLGHTLGRASSRMGTHRPPTTRRPTAELLEELGELVKAHAEGGYASLADEPRFWALIRHLYARHRTGSKKPRAGQPEGAGDDSAEAAPKEEARSDAEEEAGPSDAEEAPAEGEGEGEDQPGKGGKKK